MKCNKLIVGIGLLLIGVFALYGFANAEEEQYVLLGETSVSGPEKVAVDQDGTVYVTNGGGGSVYKIVGDGSAEGLISALSNPSGVAVDMFGDIYVAEKGTKDISKYNSEGVYSNIHTGNCGWATPYDIAYEAGTNVDIWVVESQRHIYECTPFTNEDCSKIKLMFAGAYGTDEDKMMNPSGIAVDSSDPNNICVYVADSGAHRIQKFMFDGEDGSLQGITTWGGPSPSATPGLFDSPEGVAVGPDGNVYVADTGNNRIQKFDSNGNLIPTEWGSNVQLDGPSGVAVGPDGTVYVADTVNNCIKKFSRNPLVLLQELISDVLELDVKQGIVISLDAKLANALASLDSANADQRQDAVNKLEAFKNAVEAQSGVQIDEGDADDLIAAADAIIALLQL